jgi:hypothetical protein
VGTLRQAIGSSNFDCRPIISARNGRSSGDLSTAVRESFAINLFRRGILTHHERILFAFDAARAAILLVGGNKRGDKRWHKKNLPTADERFRRHLERLRSGQSGAYGLTS